MKLHPSVVEILHQLDNPGADRMATYRLANDMLRPSAGFGDTPEGWLAANYASLAANICMVLADPEHLAPTVPEAFRQRHSELLRMGQRHAALLAEWYRIIALLTILPAATAHAETYSNRADLLARFAAQAQTVGWTARAAVALSLASELLMRIGSVTRARQLINRDTRIVLGGVSHPLLALRSEMHRQMMPILRGSIRTPQLPPEEYRKYLYTADELLEALEADGNTAG